MNEIVTRRLNIEGNGMPPSIGVSIAIIRGAQPGPVLALLGGVHGDEWEGVAAVGRICRALRDREIRGEVRAVSVCNEAAFHVLSRTTPQDASDLARCFPGDRQGSLTQRLAALLADEVIRGADFLIDLHSAGLHYTMPTLVGFIGGDDIVARKSAEAAASFGAPVVWRHPPPAPLGRTISVAYESGIPAIYAETTGAGELRAGDVECYMHGVLHVMWYLSMLVGDPPRARPALRLVGNGDLDAATVRTHHGGMFIRSVELLQRLQAGDEVGTIVDPAGDVLETLVAVRGGVVVMLRHIPKVDAGDRICHLANLEDGENHV